MVSKTSIQHVNLMVDDLATADSFYHDVLGLERASTPDLGFPAQFFKVDNTQELHLNELPDIRPERAHFCLRVDDFDATFHRVHQIGIIDTETWGKVRCLPSGVMQMFVRDPTGNLIELSCEASQEVDLTIFDLDIVDSATLAHRTPGGDGR